MIAHGCWPTFLVVVTLQNYFLANVIRAQQADNEQAWRERCLKAKCDVIFQTSCPEDSILIAAEPPLPPECCRKPDKCVCNKHFCETRTYDCTPSEQLILTKIANFTPGNCCDTYKCVPMPRDCSPSSCPKIEPPECPEDSFRPNRSSTFGEGLEKSVSHSKNGLCCPPPEPCVCKSDYCKPINCQNGEFHAEISKKGSGQPGECCDVFECTSAKAIPCNYLGKSYEDGSSWKPNPCTECVCKNGVNFCKKFQCPDTNWCSLVKVPENECCPVCIGCKSENGDFHNFTEKWDKDECTSCACGANGAILCHEQMCTQECPDPVKVPGQCCPVCERPYIVKVPFVCPSIELCQLFCEHGMKRNSNGCFSCECQDPWDTKIPPIVTHNSPKKVQNCPVLDENSCAKKCIHGFERDSSNCLTCSCKVCPSINYCYKTCLNGFEINEHGCTLCKCKGSSTLLSQNDPKNLTYCNTNEGQKDHGEWWFDGCRYCYCADGLELCSILSCPDLQPGCKNIQTDPNGCCPVCTDTPLLPSHNGLICHSPDSGRTFVEGEVWQLDKCTTCTCHIGHVLCSGKICPPAPCSNPTVSKDGCCPLCLAEPNTNQTSLILSQTTYCIVGKNSYPSGSQWKNGDCESCNCRQGQMECFQKTCPEIQCSDRLPLKIKNSCCQVCADWNDKKICRFNNLVYNPGEAWADGFCRNCTCTGEGSILCTQYECPQCPDQRSNFSEIGSMPKNQCCSNNCFDSNRYLVTNVKNDYPSSKDSLQSIILLCTLCMITLFLLLIFAVAWWHHRTQLSRNKTRKRCTSNSSTCTTATNSSCGVRPIMEKLVRYKLTSAGGGAKNSCAKISGAKSFTFSGIADLNNRKAEQSNAKETVEFIEEAKKQTSSLLEDVQKEGLITDSVYSYAEV